jgi:hypothetical protein
MSLSSAWKTNNFVYGNAFSEEELSNVPTLDIVRGKIILAEFNGSGIIINNPTPFFILTTSKIYNTNGLGNLPSDSSTTAYEQFLLTQGNSKDYGKTAGSITNNQDSKNFYFTPFVSQVNQDLVPVYGYYDPVSKGIGFFRADIFTDSYLNFIENNPFFVPNYTLENPFGQNKPNLVYLCGNYSSFYGSYSSFLTEQDMSYINKTPTPSSATNIPGAGIIFYLFENMIDNTIIPGNKYRVNSLYQEYGGLGAPNVNAPVNFLTSLGGTASGGSSNNSNIPMGFLNSNVFYQNDSTNYIGTFYPDNDYDGYADWSMSSLISNYFNIPFPYGNITSYDNINKIFVMTGITQYMVFQFLPLTYLFKPEIGNVSKAPTYLNLTYPPSNLIPPEPYPTSLPNLNLTTWVNPSIITFAITNWYSNTTSVACGTKVISNSFCGFTPQYYYNSLQGIFYELKDNPICGETFDPPADVTDVTAGTVQGFSKSCGNTAACVPNFIYDLDITQTPFICGPNGAKFDSTDYYGMTYNNFYNYFFILPPNGIPYSLTSFTPQPYIDTEKISQNSEGTPKTTFWNSSVFILLAVIFFVLILGFIVYYIYKQNTKKNPFPKYLNKYYT